MDENGRIGEMAKVKDDKEKLGWSRHLMRLNPERDGGSERVVFEGAGDGGRTVVVRSGEVVVLSHEEWERMKDLVDGWGRKFLVRA